MNHLLYLAHAGHEHQNHNATLKGEDAIAVTVVAILAVTIIVILFNKFGSMQKPAKAPTWTKK